ncbi:hypothetical protein DFH09DRAFT_1355045 [Mycena vulgaris]|nr:hypothetical protein DFH09DRAFT_1355045 [Mycena vulgaris]
MPSLPIPPPSAPTFAASQLIGLVVFVVVVLSVSGLYFLGLRVSDKLTERRARGFDAENASKPAAVVVAKEKPITVDAKTTAAALVAARADLPVKAKAHVAVAHQERTVPSRPLSTGNREAHVRPGPSPLRVAGIAPEPLAAPHATHLVSVVTLKTDPIVITSAVQPPPVAVTLANFVSRAYHTYDSESDVPAPAVLGVSQILNASLHRAAHVKRPCAPSTRRTPSRAHTSVSPAARFSPNHFRFPSRPRIPSHTRRSARHDTFLFLRLLLPRV